MRAASEIKMVWGDGVLVKMIADEGKTSGGLYVPESVIENRKTKRKSVWRAQIVKFGPKVDHKELFGFEGALKAGDIVLVDKLAIDCPHFYEGDEKYYIIRDEDIIALVEEANGEGKSGYDKRWDAKLERCRPKSRFGGRCAIG